MLWGFFIKKKEKRKLKPKHIPFSRCNDRKVLKTWNQDLLSQIKVIYYERKMIGRSAKVAHEFLTTKILFQDTKNAWEVDSSIPLILIEIKVLKHG